MKKIFNFKTFQEWFNDNYSWDNLMKQGVDVESLPEGQDDFRLDEGWFPEDGECGMYRQGYEIAQQVYEEGIDLNIEEFPEILGHKFPGLIKKEDILECRKSTFNSLCLLLPFKEEYIPIFEFIAKLFTQVEPRVSLEDYLNS